MKTNLEIAQSSVFMLHKTEFVVLLTLCMRHQNNSGAAASVLNILKNIKVSHPVAWYSERFPHLMTNDVDIANRWKDARPLFNFEELKNV